MGEYHITGGKKINGEVTINGAKNAVLPILAATILNEGKSVIHNCPKISDTFVTIEILKAIGCKVEWEGTSIIVHSEGANNSDVPEKLVKEMRSSIIFLGSLLSRFKQVKICYPGGCEF